MLTFSNHSSAITNFVWSLHFVLALSMYYFLFYQRKQMSLMYYWLASCTMLSNGIFNNYFYDVIITPILSLCRQWIVPDKIVPLHTIHHYVSPIICSNALVLLPVRVYICSLLTSFVMVYRLYAIFNKLKTKTKTT